MLPNSEVGGSSTETQQKVEKINLYFDDNILDLKRFSLRLFPWARIGELKKQLAKMYGEKVFWKDIRLFYKNIELVNEKKGFFDHYKIEPDSVIIIMKNKHETDIEHGLINPYQIFDKVPQKISNLLLNIQSGLSCGRKPKLASEGTSGTYFLQNQFKKIVAVYKPFDEEPYAPNNPRNLVGELGQQGIRKGILSGECATRQVAAYLLDQKQFHQVPATTYVEFYHPSFSYKNHCQNHPIISSKECTLKIEKTKHGSLQEFVEYNEVVGNLGSNQFDVDEVHKVAILDLRILNCDRNEANILVHKILKVQKNKETKFMRWIPIDHGLSFPDNLQIYDYQIIWMSYRQTKMPLSQKSLEFIRAIDPAKDCNLLRDKLGFRQICLRNFRIAQIFLRNMALAGFTLYEIGTFVYRTDDEDSAEEENQNHKISDLQKLVKQAETIFFTVKENGIKSTVQFQIGLIKSRRQEESSLVDWHGTAEEEKEKPSIDPKKCRFLKNNFSKVEETSIEKNAKIQGNPRSRNISLPHLLKKTSSLKKKKTAVKKDVKKAGKAERKQNWGDIFFHYFEGLLDRFIEEKLKAKRKPASRARLMSEDIQL